MKKVLPELDAATNVFIVTDQEKAITQANAKVFPNLKCFLCWNHVLQDTKRWLKSHGVSTQRETTYYTDSVRLLLHSNSEAEYKDRLLVKLAKWSKPFCTYFMDTIHSSINQLAAWELHQFGLEDISTNQSESFNFVLKKLQDWKEAPIDALCLSLLRLCQFYIAEIKRGYSGLGNYTLSGGRDVDRDAVSMDEAVDHTTIVDSIQNSLKPPTQVSTATLLSAGSPLPSTVSSATSSTHSSTAEENQSQDPHPSTNTEDLTQLSIQERASRIIQTNKLSFNPQLSVFTVMGTREPHVVRLFPTTTCSCPARSHCYHIVAARMAIGCAGNSTMKRPLNLTQLRRNKKKRADKTSGRKQPRILDEDVIPAASDAEEDISAQRDDIPTQDNNVAPVPEEPGFREDVIPAPSAAEDIPTRDYPSVAPVREEPEFRDDICYSCSAAVPPVEKHKSSKHKKTHWIECDTCPRWYHNVCVNVSNRKRKYICDMCI